MGALPTPTGVAAVKPPVPLPISTLTLLLLMFATRASRSPSPSTSPSATEKGSVPAPTGVAAVKPPAPLPISTLTLLLALVRDQGVEVARERDHRRVVGGGEHDVVAVAAHVADRIARAVVGEELAFAQAGKGAVHGVGCRRCR